MSYLARLLARRIPAPLLVLAGLLYGLAAVAVFVARRWWLVYPLGAVAGCWWLVQRYGPATVAAGALYVAALVAIGLGYWSQLGPDSFDRALAGPVRSLRRRRYYEHRWADAMDGCGLVRAGVEPTLMSVRAGRTVDELHVHVAPGSLLVEWRDAARRLASALEVRSVRVRQDGPRDVLLLVRHSAVDHREFEPAVDDEIAETAEQIRAEIEAEPIKPAGGGAFPRRPS